MAIYHCSIMIIGRTGGRSAVASAAYRSGERLYNDETGITHDFSRKRGVVLNEILLPENAPQRYLDRELLWNEVQKMEVRSDAQFAREVEVALPVEMTRAEQITCVRDFIQENFVRKGMIADWALHDKGDGNPHAHILLTVRGLDEKQNWEKKTQSVFANARDEKGRPVYDPCKPSYDPKEEKDENGHRPSEQFRIPVLDESGEQKVRIRKGKGAEKLWERITIPANDWNDHAKAEEWRQSWAEHCNQYLKPEKQIDHRSYKRQGIEIEPQIHEGVTARKMEQAGKVSDRCEVNREIRARNRIRKQIMEEAKKLTGYIREKAGELIERFRLFREHAGAFDKARGDDEYFGRTTDGDRGALHGEQTDSRRTRRITEFKRTAEQTDQNIDRTESEIRRTARNLAELAERVKRKEVERNERYERLLKRRSASDRFGTDAGPDRIITGSEHRTPEGEHGIDTPKKESRRSRGFSR